MFCLLSSSFYFIGDKIAFDCFKDKIKPSLKSNYRLKFSQDVALDRIVENRKPRWKLLYKVLKEEYEYDPFLDISIYPILMQLKDYFDGIQHCVIVVGKGIFDSNFSFELPLTKDNL